MAVEGVPFQARRLKRGSARHDHIPDHLKPILPPNLFEDAQENIARTPTPQKRFPSVATAADKMKVMMTVNPFQTRWHGAPL